LSVLHGLHVEESVNIKVKQLILQSHVTQTCGVMMLAFTTPKIASDKMQLRKVVNKKMIEERNFGVSEANFPRQIWDRVVAAQAFRSI
jgi:hypothetical protein